MVLVLFLLGIIIVAIILLILVLLSTIKINIKKLKANIIFPKKSNYYYNIQIGLYLFNKIPIAKINIDKSKNGKSKIFERLLKYRQNQSFRINAKILKTIINMVTFKVEKLNFYLKISTENAAFTSFAVAIISSIISIFLPLVVDKQSYKNVKYIVEPVYNDKNEIDASFDSIIYVKVVHIISIIYIVLQKRRVGKHGNGRASNRRTYAHSYE